MENKMLKRYKIYEYIRDEKEITAEISNTKKMMIKLLENDKETVKYCNRKSLEEKKEVEEAKFGNHFHENMTKREILVNEISQYMYWLTIIDICQNIKFENSKVLDKINEILDSIDISKIDEIKEITLDEIIEHDFEDMRKKSYLSKIKI